LPGEHPRGDHARRAGGETPIPSKAHALNLGDNEAHFFPRLYIDADIVVSRDAILRTADVLRRGAHCPEDSRRAGCDDCGSCAGPILAAAPRVRIRLEHSSWAVRAFYNIWARLPYCTDGMTGSGFYGLSEEGRRRFRAFPPIISDDGYVRLLFPPQQRAAVGCVSFELSAPRDLASLVRVKTRSQFDNRQLRHSFPELQVNDRRDYRPFVKQVITHPRLWPMLGVYCLVLGVARVRSVLRWHWGQHGVWDRDESSRASSPVRARPVAVGPGTEAEAT
jgi:hypothetical protein